MTKDLLDQLNKLGVVHRYRPGEIMIRQGDPGTHALLLIAGRATVVCTNAAGRQLLVAVVGPGSLTGEMAVLDGGSRSATVTAVDGCDTRIIPAAAFRDLCKDETFANQVMRNTVRNLRASNGLMVELAHLTVAERLARTLHRLLAAAGPNATEPEVIPLTQSGLAEALGVARSSLAKACASLRKERIVESSGHKLIVRKPDALWRVEQSDLD